MEQLWYTWSIEGLGGVAGYRVRAASGGLMNINSDRVRSFRSYLNYSLPQGSDPYAATMETSPVCLAFADPANEATKDPNEQRNTHVIMQKMYKGKDAYGRAGVFFVHLVDLMTDTPNDFVASDAIELWKSPFWRDSDTPPPRIDNVSLGQVRRDELRPHHEYQYLTQRFMGRLKEAEEDLKFIIQAFLLLKPGQKLYIAAPPDYVATLIWGLTHSLPRSLQQAQKLTFSTYEQDVTKATARVVGTCQPTITHQNISVKQQLLPADSFSGRGSAVALDCYTRQPSSLDKGTTVAIFAATYAQFATNHLLKGEKQILDNLLHIADAGKNTDTAQLMKTFNIYQNARRGNLPPDEVTSLLSNPELVAALLLDEVVQNNIIDLCVKNPDWWQEQGEPAIKKLRSPFVIPSEQPIKYALTALATQAATRMANSMLVDNTPAAKATTKATQLLLLAAAPPDQELAPWIHLLQKFAEQSSRDQNFHPVKAFTWETYSWLLEQWTYGYGHIDNRLIRPWLLMDWPSLYKFLEMREKLPVEWRRTAIANTIFGYANIPHAPGEKLALFWMEDKRVAFPLFVEALQELMRDPRSRPAALWYYTTLVNYGYKDKDRYLLISLLTVSSQTPDQDVDGFLEAAKLTSREMVDWLKDRDRGEMLLAHRLTPSIAAVIREYIKNLSPDKLDNAETKRILRLLYRHHAKLRDDEKLASQVQDWYFAGDWTLLKDEQTQLARNIKPDYLRKLSEAIQHLELKNNKKFKESLLLLLIYNIRSLQNLYDVMDILFPVLSSDFFWDLVKYRGERYSQLHSPDSLMPYVQCTLTYAAVRFQARNQAQKKHEFLENALPQLLQNADTRTFEQIDAEVHKYEDELQQLWSKYSQKLHRDNGILPFDPSSSWSRQPMQNAAPVQKQPPQQAENKPISPAPYQGNLPEQNNLGNQQNQVAPPLYRQPDYPTQKTTPEVGDYPFYSPEQSQRAALSPILPEQGETKQSNQPAQQNSEKVKAVFKVAGGAVSGAIGSVGNKLSQFIQPGHPATPQTQPTSTEPEARSNSMNAAIPEELVRRVHALKPLYIELRKKQIKKESDRLLQQGGQNTEGIIDELDGLEKHTNSEQTTHRMLENDRIIQRFLSNNTQAKFHFNELFPQVYEEVKKSSDYKKYQSKPDERDLEEMLSVFVRYRALCWYFKQQHSPQNMNVWLREQGGV